MDNEDMPSINYEDNEIKGTVAYKRCSGEGIKEEPLSGIQFKKDEAFLFKDFIPEELMKEKEKDWIFLFDSKTDAAYMWHSKFQPDGLPVSGMICNFPDFAKSWDISENGCKVFFEGITYVSSFGGTANQVLIDYVLTTLKK
jgi:hypothetical protein